jgi:uncharacterized membrane protein
MELHPAIVHFPIALLTVAAFFAVISLVSKKELFKALAFWNLLLGVIGAITAVLTGLMEERTLVHNVAIHKILEKHEMNGILILVLSFTLLTWYLVRKNKFRKNEYILWVLFLVISAAMTFYQGYLGGKMVFGEGAGVKPMEVNMNDSTATHIHSNPAHEHGKVRDRSAPKKEMPEHGHSNPVHDQKIKQGPVKKRDSIPAKEKKKELNDMKY